MRQRDKQAPQSAEETVSDIRRATRRHFSAEEKIRIVLEGLRSEDSIAELCRKEGIAQILYYRWSKEFLEAGKKGLAGDTAREASSDCAPTFEAVPRLVARARGRPTMRLQAESTPLPLRSLRYRAGGTPNSRLKARLNAASDS